MVCSQKEMLKWAKQRRIEIDNNLPKSNIQKNSDNQHKDKIENNMSSSGGNSFGVAMERIFRRKSLGHKTVNFMKNENKENIGNYYSPVPSYRRSLTPLQDLSNGQSPKTINSQDRQVQNNCSILLTRRNSCAMTLNNNSSESLSVNINTSDRFDFSNDFVKNSNAHLKNDENSLSSSRIGDTTLNKMIDAIIESARREDKCIKRVRHKSDSFEDFYEPSVHEMEVKTPPTHHLKRQKVVRRKHKSEPPSKDKLKNRIGLTLPNGIPSPETPIDRFKNSTKTYDELAKLDTPQGICFVVDSLPTTSREVSNCSNKSTNQRCSTPTIDSKTNAVKRCLSFSPNSDDDFSQLWNCKRDSVASSSTSSSSIASNRTIYRTASIKGSVDIKIFEENGNLNVHVIRCRGLERPNGSSDVNAYVKVALLPPDDVQNENHNHFKRTAVHRNSSRPYFDHKFKFDIRNEKNLMKRVQLAVWHRDRELKRSEFLGCMSFPVKNVLKCGVNGSYKLQSQECLTNPLPPIPLNTLVNEYSNNFSLQHQLSSLSPPSSSSSISTNKAATLFTNNNNDIKNSIINTYLSRETDMATIADRRQQSVEEDVISIDSASAAAQHLIDANTGQPIALSKKAIHQRDADENLFLRFLELDPPNDQSSNRRMSTFKPAMGRTPFTITKKLTRTADKGYGFSIVWTHPPRVEKVEPGMSADRAGILPGDYVIFVDKHNIVTMPESDVLNLIRSLGNTLTLEIFRRTSSTSIPSLNASRSAIINGVTKSRVASAASNYTYEEMSPALKQSVGLGQRSSTACSNTSIETTKRRLNLPQVTFSKESITPVHGAEDHRRRLLLQLVSREQNYINALHFGIQRFVQPLCERKDLISPNDHRTLFQNIDELVRISEDILEQLTQVDHEPQLNFASRVYLSKTTAICAAYKKYCNGIKRADCVLVNKSRQAGSEFVSFITEPQVPRKRPDLTMFIHRPLQHFREILKLMQLLASHCHVDSEEHRNFTSVINELQAAYREITVGGGLMEPLGEGRPLLTLQDLESRMVFTRCKPFTLAVQGRQWIFGGDLSRVEGRSIKPYWTLLFSDIIVFAKVSRDRVLFITEEPLPIGNIVDSCFNIRKKNTEFRITVDPNGRLAESPTGYCAPDLTITPKKNIRRKTLILRAPSLELKAVWQNLLQRQIFLVNAALSTPLSSPLDSPDVLNTLVPLSDIGATTASMASMKISSMDSINLKNQQNRQVNPAQHLEQLIDEKCRILNKSGTPKGSALHLANWMKGQLDKQQEQARLAAAQSKERLDKEDSHLLEQNECDDERITYWTREQLEKRTKELNFAKENGNSKPLHDNFSGRRLSGVEEIAISDVESEVKSVSRSTTSDSQITVRSSPNANVIDKLSVCRHCHKNCKQKLSPSPPLLNYSLKVQHSQSSPNRCCQLNSVFIAPESNASAVGTISNSASADESCDRTISSTSSTITEEQRNRIEYTDITEESNQNLEQTTVSTTSIPSTPASTSRLLNGTWSESESSDQDSKHTNKRATKNTPSVSPITTTTTITTSSIQKPSKLYSKKTINHHIPCTCKCTPEDFSNTTLSPDELKQETCKIIEDVTQLTNSQHDTNSRAVCSPQIIDNDPHKNCICVCKNNQGNQKSIENKSDDELSLVLIGLAQFNPAAKLVHSDSFVPTISVVPPTPEPVLSKTMTNIWDNTTCTATKLMINNTPGQAIIENIPEDSPDESPQDEEPPYRSLNTKLRRYGTMSSLEKLAADDLRTIGGGGEHSSEEGEEDDEDEDEVDGEEEDDDIEVITRQVFTGVENNQASLRNWTARAGSYVAEKMSFFEESRAFIDKYLGRWNQEHGELDHRGCVGEEEQMEECTSGATSGEEVWGTPTSGGDNEDMQMGSSEHTQSSPTKSNSSLNDDDDTELMMDELLMAPPMTASTIRGLLPRRRLEPLFEEETESDEERDHQESSGLATKGETSTNGHDLDISIGRLRNDGLNHIIRPVISHGQLLKTTSITSIETETKIDSVPKVTAVSTMIRTTSIDAINTNGSNSSNDNNSLVKTTATGVTTISTTTTSLSSITSGVVVTSSVSTATTTITTMTSTVRRAKFSPPPPPPRRLLLTQTDTKGTNTQQQTEIHRVQDSKIERFGDIADIGSSVVAPNTGHPIRTVSDQNVVSNMKNYAGSTDLVEDRQSKTTDRLITASSATTTMTTLTTSMSISHETQSSTNATELITTENQSQSPSQKVVAPGSSLSPRLEMRLALNHDILGDEDLINYDPGPDLTTILGHDLSTFHRLTGRDLLNRSANRIQPKEAVISYSQQRNSKMDTPTLNRKRHQQHHLQQQLQQNRNTLNSSAFVDRIGGNDISADSCKSSNNSSEGSKLSDLEILAKREKMYCMSQLKSGSPARKANMTTTTTTVNTKVMMKSTSSTALDPEIPNRAGIKGDSKTNRIFNFLTRRNSENQLTKIISRDSLTESNASSTPTPDRRILSPRKDNDKPSLNRRFWKQLTKRRRSNSVSELIAS